MSQHIACEIYSVTGSLICDSNLNFALIKNELWNIDKDKKKYTLLHKVEEYSDTMFKYNEIPDLIIDFKRLKDEVDIDTSGLIDEFIEFMSKTKEGQYIKFIGD